MTEPIIPFLDLVPEHRELLPAMQSRLARVFAHGRFVMGPEIDELEADLAAYVGTRHAIACQSGTTALLIALMSLGIGPGDEVILPAYTFAAPLEMVLLLGATPVLADIEPDTCCLAVGDVRRKLSERTRVVIAVSLYGQPADMTALAALTAGRDIVVIEDGAQSFGASLEGRRSGNLSRVACTSFFPTKPLGGCGDGGALFTHDTELAERMQQVRNHGQAARYEHVRLGLNGRMDSLNAAMLQEKFGMFPQALLRRQALAARYSDLLSGHAPVALPVVRAGVVSAWAQYAIQVERRDTVAAHMRRHGVETSVHYASPLHHQPAFGNLSAQAVCPVAEQVAARVLCLPLYPALRDGQQDRIVAALLAATV